MEEKLLDANNLTRYIKEAEKKTPVKVYIKGRLEGLKNINFKLFGTNNFWVAIGDYNDIKSFLSTYNSLIDDYELENDRRNSAIPLLDLTEIKARIEPGALIRDKVSIGEGAVIMMGAVINIGAEIGSFTMIDMNAVIGARGIIGNNCHIGAGAVIAGVLEPPSKNPVVIEDDVLVGANAVILEGVRIGRGAVIGALSVVTCDVEENTVVAGVPAKVIKKKDTGTVNKTQIVTDLRK